MLAGNLYEAHRDPEWFSDPKQFHPSRFTDDVRKCLPFISEAMTNMILLPITCFFCMFDIFGIIFKPENIFWVIIFILDCCFNFLKLFTSPLEYHKIYCCFVSDTKWGIPIRLCFCSACWRIVFCHLVEDIQMMPNLEIENVPVRYEIFSYFFRDNLGLPLFVINWRFYCW